MKKAYESTFETFVMLFQENCRF